MTHYATENSQLIEQMNDALPTLTELRQRTCSLVVNNESAFHEIAKTYKDCRALEALIKSRLKEANAKPKEAINQNNYAAQRLLDPLSEIIIICNTRTNQYQTILAEQKRKEEEEAMQAAAILDMPVTYIAPATKPNAGPTASITTKTQRTYELEDISKVPLQYLTLNDQAIRQALKLGVGTIPGLKVSEEQVASLRTK